MPPELGDGGTMHNPGPAIAATRSRRLLNLKLFQSKRYAAPDASSAGAKQHHRGGSMDSSATTTCLGGGTFHWQHRFRDALFCEPPLSSSTPCHVGVVGEPSSDESGRKVSRWWRIVGRFGGKNRVREETAQPKEQKKARVEMHLKPKVAEEEPRCDSDLSLRIARSDEDSRRRYELVEPVLEPMRFVTSDLPHCCQPEERIAPPSDDGGAHVVEPQKLGFRPLDFDRGDKTITGVVQECRNLVANLRRKRGKEQGVVAAEARLLAKDHPPARVMLASLGAVAPLISMLDSPSSFCAHSALLTLYTLAIGNDLNKAAIVDAGVVPKLLTLLRKREPSSILEAVVANFLSYSALDRNKYLIGSTGAIPPIVQTLNQNKEPIRRESLRALYNLSLCQSNIKFFVEGEAVTGVMEILKTRDNNVNAEKALAVLGNMVGVGIGRKSVTETAQSLETLIGVLGWGVQFAKCQERAAYILMVIAHQSYLHRQAMVQSRAIPALLEVSLLGSALAQKRAVRILECLREDREQGPARPMSAPMAPGIPIPIANPSDPGEGSKVVNHMVQQSLEQNLQRIVRRANLPLFEIGKAGDGVTRAFSLSGCSSSKSLPF